MSNLIRSELHKYASFPVAAHDLDFLLAVADHIDPHTRKVKDSNYNVVMTLDSVFFNNVFKGSAVEEVADITKENAQEYYEKNEAKCKKMISIVFLSSVRGFITTRWPK